MLKTRAVAEQRDKFDSDRQDLIRLLSFADDPRALSEDGRLKKSERKWLRDIKPLLAFNDSALADIFPIGEVFLAEKTYRLLIAQ